MGKFTQILESYKEKNLKALSEMINEEPTEDEFNKELEINKKLASGKIRKKGIAKAAVQAVEVQKEEVESLEETVMDSINHKKFGKVVWVNDGGSHIIHTTNEKGNKVIHAFGTHKEIANKWQQLKQKFALKTEEVESLDELNKDTLYSYQKKSDKDLDNKLDDMDKSFSKGDVKGANKAQEITRKRFVGLERVGKRLNKEEIENLVERDDREDDEGYDRTKKEDDEWNKRNAQKRTPVTPAKKKDPWKKVPGVDESTGKSFKAFRNLAEESLNEWNAVGHKSSDGERWLKKMGFSKVSQEKHPKWQHETTGETVTGWGDHGKDIKPEAARTTYNLVKDHHKKHSLPFKDM
jgi:hypothetical protein